MTKTNPTKMLNRLIHARHTVIAIASYEEARVTRAILEIAAKQTSDPAPNGKLVVAWAYSTGLRALNPSAAPKVVLEKLPTGEDTQEPAAALRELGKWSAAKNVSFPTLFVFKDLHAFFKDPMVVRFLRDVAVLFESIPCTLILLSPQMELPAELEKDVRPLDWPLPDSDELAEVLDLSIKNLPERVKVDLAGPARADLLGALSGLTVNEATPVLSTAVVTHRTLDVRAIKTVLEEKKNLVKKGGFLEFYDADTSFADVGGLDLLKSYAQESIAAFSPEARAYGVDMPRGLLLVGVPGAGKSLMAKTIAQGKMPTLRLDFAKLMGGLVGKSEGNLFLTLRLAEAMSPCVLWIDEGEKGMSGMNGGGENDGGTSRRMFGSFLTWQQEHTAPVYPVMTANDPTGFAPEFLRRFDDVFFTDLPVYSEREEILRIHLAKRGRTPDDFDLAEIANRLEGFTGSEIEKVVVSAIKTGWKQGARLIATADLIASAGSLVPVSVMQKDAVDALRLWGKARARPASSAQSQVWVEQSTTVRGPLEIE